MTQSDEKTIRLQNLSFGNLSLHLQQFRAMASPGLRRGLMLTPILIGQGKYFDVCKELGVSYDEATRIIQASPEVRAFAASNALMIIDYPPPPEAEVVVKKVTLIPATPAPDAEPPLVSVPLVFESETPPGDFILGTVTLAEPEKPQLAPTVDMSPPAPSAPMPVIEDVPPAPPAPTPAPAADPNAVLEEPSMDWLEDRLRAFAKAQGVDVSKAKSKTAVLRAIREKG